RLPAGLAYRADRARTLMVAALLVMSACTYLYSYAVEPLQFALVQAFNGFSFGAASTTYLAFYIDHLPPDEDRHHAMGYYTGCLPVGYSLGGFAAGYIADKLGYETCFHYAAWLGLVCIVLLFLLSPRRTRQSDQLAPDKKSSVSMLTALKGIVDPKV